MKKRICSMLLVVVMLMALVPTAAFAYSSSDVKYAVTDGYIYFNKATGTVVECDSTVTKADIPSEISGIKVIGIGNSAFCDCAVLTEICLPKTIKYIENNAFLGCDSLESFYYNGSVRQWKENVEFTGDFDFGTEDRTDALSAAKVYFLDPTDPFSDIKGWYHNFVYECYSHDIVGGYPDGTFRPDADVTRAEFVMMLYNMCGKEDVSDYGEPSFSDTKNIYQGFKDAILWGSLNDIVAGFSDKTFRPNENVTRAQMATFAYRLMKQYVSAEILAQLNAANLFKDSSNIDDCYVDAVNVLAEAGIISGFEDNTFRPNATATRAQAAKILLLVHDFILQYGS